MAIHAEPVFQFSPSTSVTTAPDSALGDLTIDEHGNTLMLVLVGGSVAATVGAPVGWKTNDSTGYTVTADISASKASLLCGMCLAAGAAGTYQYIMMKGDPRDYVSTIVTTATASANEYLYWADDSTWSGIATHATTRVIGQTRIAGSATTTLSVNGTYLFGVS